ncbi:MAG: hypothetical protein Q9184_006198, partial [Pyrenodesmia sp. 2 TL-2023]
MRQIEFLECQIKDKDRIIALQQNAITTTALVSDGTAVAELALLKRRIELLDGQISNKDQTITFQENSIRLRDITVQERDRTIQGLHQEIATLRAAASQTSSIHPAAARGPSVGNAA